MQSICLVFLEWITNYFKGRAFSSFSSFKRADHSKEMQNKNYILWPNSSIAKCKLLWTFTDFAIQATSVSVSPKAKLAKDKIHWSLTVWIFSNMSYENKFSIVNEASSTSLGCLTIAEIMVRSPFISILVVIFVWVCRVAVLYKSRFTIGT